MSNSMFSPSRRGDRIFSLVSIQVVVYCAILILMGTIPVNAAETGIRGVVLWGPVRPGPARLGQSDEAPLRATFHVVAADREVAQFESDKMGIFEVHLPAGDYTIVPDKGTQIPAPHNQIRSVTVPADGFAEITLRFDTGMR